MCKDCTKKASNIHMPIYRANSDKSKIWSRNDYRKNTEKHTLQRLELKTEVFKYYSPQLKCTCGYDDIRALSIDHINNDGAKHRKELFKTKRGGGTSFYRWLKNNHYPEGFQVLCMNCQFIKSNKQHEQLRKSNNEKWNGVLSQ